MRKWCKALCVGEEEGNESLTFSSFLCINYVLRLFFLLCPEFALFCSVLVWRCIKIIGSRSRCMGFGVRIIYLLISIPALLLRLNVITIWNLLVAATSGYSLHLCLSLASWSTSLELVNSWSDFLACGDFKALLLLIAGSQILQLINCTLNIAYID